MLVGADGRVRVLDFGLALPARGSPAPRANEMSEETSDAGALGAIAGTPAYMSPEQYEGRELDARSDQFSFCVSAWEALHGEHPFAAGNLWAMAERIAGARVHAPPRASRVPKRLTRVLLRGLSLRPEDRYPDMPALIAALERDPWRTVRRALPWLGGAAAAAGLAGGVWLYFEPGMVEVRALREGRAVPLQSVEVGATALELGPEGARGAVAAGTQRVRVVAEGYEPDESVVEVQRGRVHQITRELRREQGRFTLDVEPGGGSVFVDGEDRGSRLRGLAVDTGLHEISARKEGYHTATLRWTATRGEERRGYVALAPGQRWSRRAASGWFMPEALRDLTGDGEAELLHRHFNILKAIDARSDRTLWTLDFGAQAGVVAALVDVDGDGAQELFTRWAEGEDSVVALWSPGSLPAREDAAPTRLWTRREPLAAPNTTSRTRLQALACDVDGDASQDLVVIGTDQADVAAYSGRDGRALWHRSLAEPPLVVDLLAGGAGPPPVVGVTARRGFSLDAATGAVRWDMPVSAGRGFLPLVVAVERPEGGLDDVVVAAEGEKGSGLPMRVCAAAGLDGRERWCVERHASDRLEFGCLGPGRARGRLQLEIARSVEVLDATTGAPQWTAPFALPHPMIAGDPLLYAAYVGEDMVVGTVSDGRERLRTPMAGRATAPPIRHDWDGDGVAELVFASESRELVALAEASGEPVGAVTLASPALALRSAGDLDMDGLSDMLVRTHGGPALVGGPKLRWSRRADGALRATPTLADLDGDGDLELAVFGVFEGQRGLHIFDAATVLNDAAPTERSGPDVIRGAAEVPAAGGGIDLVVMLARGDVGELRRYSGRDGALLTTYAEAGLQGYARPGSVRVGGESFLATSPWETGDGVLFDAATLRPRRRIALGDGSWTPPVLVDTSEGEVLVFALHNTGLRAFAASDGRALWGFEIGGLPMAGAAAGTLGGETSVFVSTLAGSVDLVALDPRDGRERWRVPGAGAQRARPLVADLDGDGTSELIAATDALGLVVLDAQRRTRWRHAPAAGSVQPVASGSPQVVDLEGDGGVEVLATFRDGALHVVDGRTGALRWRYRTQEAVIDAEPVTGDVDGDGVREVVLAGNDHALVVLRSTAVGTIRRASARDRDSAATESPHSR